MIDEATFIERAVVFVIELCDQDPGAIDADTPLFETGLLDSLAAISLLAFVEDQCGAALSISAEEGISLAAVSTIRAAYRLLHTGS
jgi:acyl carrier protein